MILTLSLLGLALAITGLMACAFFWPMTLVHLRDRHPDLHATLEAFDPASLLWLLAGRYRALNDPGLDGLAVPARIALIGLLFGLLNAGVFALIWWATKP
ncbi:MAG: hypothetical protein ABIT64_02905 [Lysobacteraceae bacterium]